MAIEFDDKIEETEEYKTEVVAEEKSTFVDGLKKYGPLIAGLAVITTIAIIGYVVGKKSTAGDWDEVCDELLDAKIIPDDIGEQN